MRPDPPPRWVRARAGPQVAGGIALDAQPNIRGLALEPGARRRVLVGPGETVYALGTDADVLEFAQPRGQALSRDHARTVIERRSRGDHRGSQPPGVPVRSRRDPDRLGLPARPCLALGDAAGRDKSGRVEDPPAHRHERRAVHERAQARARERTRPGHGRGAAKAASGRVPAPLRQRPPAARSRRAARDVDRPRSPLGDRHQRRGALRTSRPRSARSAARHAARDP